MQVSWELDRYDVMDIQGHLQQDNLSTEGTLIKLTAILTYEDEEERYEFYAKVFPSELSADKEEMRQLQEKVEEADKRKKSYMGIWSSDESIWNSCYGNRICSFCDYIIITKRERRKEKRIQRNETGLSANY